MIREEFGFPDIYSEREWLTVKMSRKSLQIIAMNNQSAISKYPDSTSVTMMTSMTFKDSEGQKVYIFSPECQSESLMNFSQLPTFANL